MRLIWTRKAQYKFIDILNYIEQEFGRTASVHFKIKTKEFTILLKKFPEIGTLEVRNKK